MRTSKGGGEINEVPPRVINASDVALLPGYKIEKVAEGLTFPSAIAFDDKDRLHVIETGYSYGEVWTEPQLIRLDENGSQTIIAKGGKNGPWNGVTFHNGFFYIAEGGALEGGKIFRISPTGEMKVLVDNLPSVGDHHTNGPVVKDGYVYFGQGSATNSAIVGTDNAEFGWLTRKKEFHDIPCEDITLAGENFETENVLTDDPNDKATTGAYSPFGKATSPGEVVKGKIPCNGAIMRVPIDGGQIEVVAWGLRNPFGLSFSPDGKLFVTENSYDVRGSRPVWGTGDVLWEIRQGSWYGWPDFNAGDAIDTKQDYEAPGKRALKQLLQKHPGTPPRPSAILGVHSSSNGLDFSKNAAFGYQNEAFIAQFGDMAPKVGKVLFPVGFKVIKVNVATGVVRDFAVNKGKRNGPASWLQGGGLERPVSVKFNGSGNALYIADFGILKMTEKGANPQQKTGVIWKISKQ
jgi:glucose/arabinose dehydrogenase